MKEPVFLCTLEDDIKADAFVTLLESNNIPVMRKRLDGGEFNKIYMGMSCYSIELYIPAEFNEKAKEIFLANKSCEEDYIDEEFAELKEKAENKKKTLRILLITFLVAPTLIALLIMVILMVVQK